MEMHSKIQTAKDTVKQKRKKIDEFIIDETPQD
jgi:hypothetical protein